MSTATVPIPDPTAVVEALDPQAIRAKLEDLDRQRSAWLILLRAALARRRGERQRPAGPPGTESRIE
jgi:hypothetical protein